MNIHSTLASAQQFLATRGLDFALNLLGAAAIFFFGRLAARAVAKGIGTVLQRSGTEATLVHFLNNLVYALLLVFVVIAALERMGVNTTSFIGIIAAAGLAIGLALQGSLSNFAAGVMIILLQHFKVGDRIEAGGQTGRVIDIQIFSSVLVADDGARIIVPNNSITSGVIKVHAPPPDQAVTGKEAAA